MGSHGGEMNGLPNLRLCHHRSKSKATADSPFLLGDSVKDRMVMQQRSGHVHLL